ncbi:MAG: GTP-binding protein [Deltaproteobacteria bacterium]|nr:GTP-binding protein [Deltaproteobacteria bacterium]
MNQKPDSNPDEKARILLLAGFLGSGKTTLLKRILSWEADLSDSVVLVNEFGDVGIDGALLKDSGSDVVELTSGCICCTLSADLKLSLEDIWKRFQPKRIFIESSGVADPASIISVLQEPRLMQTMQLGKVITVLDAELWEAREVFGPLFFSQMKMADLILLNKIDIQGKGNIPQYLSEMHEVFPDTQVVPTIRCNIDPETLWMDSDAKRSYEIRPTHLFKEILLEGEVFHGSDGHHHHHEDHGNGEHQEHVNDAGNFITFSFRDSGVFDESRFKAFVDTLPWELFRMKGPVRFQEGMTLVNFVGGRSEWLPWEGDAETRLAFIGWDVDGADILKKLNECIIDQ